MENLNEIFDFTLNLIKDCGKILKDGFYGVKEITLKKGHKFDFVTQYDQIIEEKLKKEIKKKFPNHKFIGEETSSELCELTNNPTWIIDPIDGTTNFIHSIPLIAINIALVVNKEIIMGITYNPISNEMYTAKKGEGAFLNGSRLQVSSEINIENSIIGDEVCNMAAIEYCRDKCINRFRNVVSNSKGVRSIGCAAISMAYVALGAFDGYFIEGVKPWDIAPGVILIREAGGYVGGLKGGEYDIMHPDITTAGTKELYNQIVDLIKNIN